MTYANRLLKVTVVEPVWVTLPLLVAQTVPDRHHGLTGLMWLTTNRKPRRAIR